MKAAAAAGVLETKLSSMNKLSAFVFGSFFKFHQVANLSDRRAN